MTLLLDALITQAVPKDTNLAETVEVSRERVQLSNGGYESRPIVAGVYVAGLPFGAQSLPVLAPIDLLAGDKLRVVADSQEREVYQITRKNKVIWVNEALVAAEASEAAAKKLKRQITRALESSG